MRLAIAAIAVLLLAACQATAAAGADARAQLVDAVWMHLDSEWESADPQSGYTASASARLLRFDADGRFAMLACLLLRNPNGTSISRGDGFVFYFGTWRSSDRGYSVDYVKVRETVHWSQDGLPYAAKQQAHVRQDAGLIDFDGVSFTRAPAFTARDFEDVTRGVRVYEASKIAELLKRR
jgi:hypothetical protein